MDMQMIRELAALFQEQQLTALEYEDGTKRIRLEKNVCISPSPLQGMEALSAAPSLEPPQEAENPGLDFNGIKTIASPLVGVFYAAPAPGEPPFVQLGDMVKKGDMLCIVEAMKVMNEIIAEKSGQVVDVCVKDGDVVEFGQTLFKLV